MCHSVTHSPPPWVEEGDEVRWDDGVKGSEGDLRSGVEDTLGESEEEGGDEMVGGVERVMDKEGCSETELRVEGVMDKLIVMLEETVGVTFGDTLGKRDTVAPDEGVAARRGEREGAPVDKEEGD